MLKNLHFTNYKFLLFVSCLLFVVVLVVAVVFLIPTLSRAPCAQWRELHHTASLLTSFPAISVAVVLFLSSLSTGSQELRTGRTNTNGVARWGKDYLIIKFNST